MNKNEITMIYGTYCRCKEGKYYLIGGFGRLVDAMAEKYDKVYLMVPVKHVAADEQFSEYCIKSSNIVVQEIPSYRSFVEAMRISRKIKKYIREYSKEWKGVIYIRWFTVFFEYITFCAKRRNLPVVFHIVEDGELVVKQGNKYKGIKRVLAIAVAKKNSWAIKRLIKECPALINGNDLRRLYSPDNNHIKEIRTSTILKSEITYSHKEMDKNDIKLLFVGRIRELKGLDYLLNSMKVLIKKGYNLSLTLVGEGDYVEQLQDNIRNMELEDHVAFAGKIGMGAELFSKYKESDIFILPSLSEGTPRTLIEAMCNGIPVVATNAGGIPFTIKDRWNGLMVPVKDSEALVMAIERVINDDQLRKTMIENGYTFAELNTIESHSDEIYQFVMSNT